MKNLSGKTNEKGLAVVAVVVLSLIGTLGLLVVRGPSVLDSYDQSLSRIRNESPTNEDMNYVKDNLGTLADAADGNLPIPTEAGDIIQFATTRQMSSMVEMASRPIPDPEQGFGQPGQTAACGISVSKTLAEPGDFVTAAVIIPKVFQSKISRIAGDAGGEGLSWPTTGGSCAFSMPPDEINPIKVRFDAFDKNGDIACSGAVTVQVDVPSDRLWIAGYTKPVIAEMALPFVIEMVNYVPAANKVMLGQGLSKSRAIEAACLKFEFLSPWHGANCSYYGQHGSYKVCISYTDWNNCSMIQ